MEQNFLTIDHPIWSSADHSSIDATVTIENYPDPMPYTIKSREEPTAWADLMAGDYGTIGAYVAPPAPGQPAPPAFRRVERFTGTVVGSAGVATVTFGTPFPVAPIGKVIDGWSGLQQITGAVSAITATGATIDVRRSRGTLVLSAGPYEIAPAGTSITIEVIGN